jgi:hypothetical protein
MSRSRTDGWTIALALLGAGSLVNGIWMLLDPPGWYVNLPAAVPDTGPLNEHFVRDIGSAFIVMGIGAVVAGFRPALRLPFMALTSLFYWLHALVHVTDTLAGRLPPSHWGIDFPGVYLPAILLAVVVAWLARTPRTA